MNFCQNWNSGYNNQYHMVLARVEPDNQTGFKCWRGKYSLFLKALFYNHLIWLSIRSLKPDFNSDKYLQSSGPSVTFLCTHEYSGPWRSCKVPNKSQNKKKSTLTCPGSQSISPGFQSTLPQHQKLDLQAVWLAE